MSIPLVHKCKNDLQLDKDCDPETQPHLRLRVTGTGSTWDWDLVSIYIYIFNLECFDILWKKTVETSPRSLDHIGSYWTILDHRSFKFCDAGKITPINKSFAGWLIPGEASSWTDPLRSLPSGMGSLTCFFSTCFDDCVNCNLWIRWPVK